MSSFVVAASFCSTASGSGVKSRSTGTRVEWLCRTCHGKQHFWDVYAGFLSVEQWQAKFPDVDPADAYEPLPGDPPGPRGDAFMDSVPGERWGEYGVE